MKTKLLLLIFLGIFSAKAQTTHNLDWERDIGSNVDLTIITGDTVIWTWIDNNHTVENDPTGTSVETFDSGFLGPTGSTFSHTFTIVGSNDYYCGIHGAASMSGTITVEDNLSIEDAFFKNFKILQNPVTTILELEFPQNINEGQIIIYDLLGKQAITNEFKNSNNKLIDVSPLKSGLYIISIESNGVSQTKRFIKQ